MPKEPEITTKTRSLVATGARVIHHSDAVDVKDWRSATKSDIVRPQSHPERLSGQTMGKRQAVREARLRAQIAYVTVFLLALPLHIFILV